MMMLRGLVPPVSLSSTGMVTAVRSGVVAVSGTAVSLSEVFPVKAAVSVPPSGGSPGGGGGTPLGAQVTLSVPVKDPALVGAKLASRLQNAPCASIPGQLLTTAKGAPLV